jgi:hypothetical protein
MPRQAAATAADAVSGPWERKVGELEAALDQAERAEQAPLHQAHESGIDILPRADTAPAAYLGVVVVVNGVKAAA